MEKLIYLSIILTLLFLIDELIRWIKVYRRVNEMIKRQKEDFINIHSKLCDEFVEQHKKCQDLYENLKKQL
ncbi:hypothetical protein [Chryseobacterium sp. M5A1_1a]